MKIDAHQHFWKFDPVRDSWITDDMKVIQRDFLPDDLAPILEANGINGCVAVQASQTEEETDFLIELASNHDFIKGIVGWVDLRSNDIDDRLAHYASFAKVKGFRHVVQGESDSEFMLRPQFKAGITALESYNFTYDILIYHYQLEQAIQLVKLFPDQRFVLDHIAKPDIKSGEYAEWQTNIKKLALHTNVYCKVSGMVTEADWNKWTAAEFKVYLDTVVKAFGTDRIMYGSDWPVCTVAASYEQQIGIVNDYFNTFSTLEKRNIMGGNATRFYGLS